MVGLWHGFSAPLPLVGRGEGWGGTAFPLGRKVINFRQLFLLMSLQENIYLSDGCGLPAPPPLTPPHQGEGCGETLR